MKKISFNKEFLDFSNSCKETENCPFVTATLYKSIKELRLPREAEDAIKEILEDEGVQKMFPGLNLDEIPFVYLISKSKIEKSIVNLVSQDGGKKQVLVLKQTFSDNKKEIIGYDYLDIDNRKIVYARSPEAIEEVRNSLKTMASKTLGDIQEISMQSNLLSRKSIELQNAQVSRIEDGNVTNLTSSIPMLLKCRTIISNAITELEGIKTNASIKQEQENPLIFEETRKKIDAEITSDKPVFIKNDVDAVKALIHRYFGKPEDLKRDYESGSLSKILPGSEGNQRHNRDAIILIAIRLLEAMEKSTPVKKLTKEQEQQNKINKINKEDRISADIERQMLSIIQRPEPVHFQAKLPGNPVGYKNEHTYQASFSITEKDTKIKLYAFIKIKDGIDSILTIFNTPKNKTLSIRDFDEKKISELGEVFKQCLVWLNTYKEDIVLQDGRINKKILGSLYGSNTAMRFYAIRYVAITIKYIETIFTKNNSVG